MSLKMVSNLDFEPSLVLHAKWCKLKLAIFTVCLKKCNFLQMTPNIGNIYQIKVSFSMINNLGSLPLKSQLFGIDQAPKVWIAWKTRNFLATFNSRSGYGWKGESKNSYLQMESRRSNDRIARNLVGEPWATHDRFHATADDYSPFLSTAVVVHLPTCFEPVGSACVSAGGQEDLHQAWVVAVSGRRRLKKEKKKKKKEKKAEEEELIV